MAITREDLESDQADRIKLSGKISPGIAIVSGLTSPRKWNIKDGYGLAGATVDFIGTKLMRFTVEFRLWEPEHFEKWGEFSKLFEVPRIPAGAPVKAMRIEHPILAEMYISSVVVEDRTQLLQVDNGVWACTVSFLQYLPPRKALGKTSAVIPTDKVNPIAKDAADLEMQRLDASVKDLQALDARTPWGG
jgi:hypothetical protein